jgi:hypothetical protein
VDETLDKNSIKFKTTLTQSLFDLYADDFPFSISFVTSKQTGHFLILNGDLEEKTIQDDIYIPNCEECSIQVRPYSVLGGDEDVDKKLILNFEKLSISKGDHLKFEFVDGGLKISKI